MGHGHGKYKYWQLVKAQINTYRINFRGSLSHEKLWNLLMDLLWLYIISVLLAWRMLLEVGHSPMIHSKLTPAYSTVCFIFISRDTANPGIGLLPFSSIFLASFLFCRRRSISSSSRHVLARGAAVRESSREKAVHVLVATLIWGLRLLPCLCLGGLTQDPPRTSSCLSLAPEQLRCL